MPKVSETREVFRFICEMEDSRIEKDTDTLPSTWFTMASGWSGDTYYYCSLGCVKAHWKL